MIVICLWSLLCICSPTTPPLSSPDLPSILTSATSGAARAQVSAGVGWHGVGRVGRPIHGDMAGSADKRARFQGSIARCISLCGDRYEEKNATTAGALDGKIDISLWYGHAYIYWTNKTEQYWITIKENERLLKVPENILLLRSRIKDVNYLRNKMNSLAGDD